MTSPTRDERREAYGEWQRQDLVERLIELEDARNSLRAFNAHFVKMYESQKDAARLVVDAEYRREQWGSDTVATFDRALEALREELGLA